MTRRRRSFIVLSAFALLVGGCSSADSESASTEDEAQESSGGPAAAVTTTTTTSGNPPKSAHECIEELGEQSGAELSPAEFVQQGLACGREEFRELVSPKNTAAVTEAFAFGTEATERYEACNRELFDNLSDDDLVKLAGDFETVYDLSYHLGESSITECFATVGTLNGLTADQILSTIALQSTDPTSWTRPELTPTGFLDDSFIEHDRVLVRVAQSSPSGLAVMSTIAFRTANPYSRIASETLVTFFELFGVDAPPPVVADALHGGTLPQTETIRFCRGFEDDNLFILAVPTGMECLEGLDAGQP